MKYNTYSNRKFYRILPTAKKQQVTLRSHIISDKTE